MNEGEKFNANFIFRKSMKINFSRVWWSTYLFKELAVVSRDLSQAEKKITIVKAEKIRNMTTIFTQNDNFCSF